MVRCNKCDWRGEEEDLIFILEDEKDLESGLNGCPNCKTDCYLSDVKIKNKYVECKHDEGLIEMAVDFLRCVKCGAEVESKIKELKGGMN